MHQSTPLSPARVPGLSCILVQGPPCTGKTTLGRYLAEELRLPLFSKDAIKETLFDTLGWSDREWSRKLGRASIELLYTCMETELAAGRSFIVEANFDPDLATPRFLELKQKYGFVPLQLSCYADGPTLAERFRQRDSAGERHPGHVYMAAYEEIAPTLFAGRYPPLDIGGPVLEIDTTDFAHVDYARIVEAIRTSGE